MHADLEQQCLERNMDLRDARKRLESRQAEAKALDGGELTCWTAKCERRCGPLLRFTGMAGRVVQSASAVTARPARSEHIDTCVYTCCLEC